MAIECWGETVKYITFSVKDIASFISKLGNIVALMSKKYRNILLKKYIYIIQLYFIILYLVTIILCFNIAKMKNYNK